MRATIYDAGLLIAADRNERRVWAEHRVRLEAGLVPVVPCPVLAQVSRSSKQAQLRRFLRGCELVPLDETLAHAAGGLLGKARTSDVVDAAVVALAIARRADIVTDDAKDIERLIAASGANVSVVAV